MSALISPIIRWLGGLPKPLLAIVNGSLLLLTGLIDFLVKVNLGFSIFYVIPISIFTWYFNPKIGYLSGFLATLLWFFAENSRDSPDTNAYSLAWNTCVRLSFFILIVVLLEELQIAYRRERKFARTDSLTSLLNRRAFLEILEYEIRRSQRYHFSFTLVYFDVDNFKRVNDQRGHAEGDRLLQTIGVVLTKEVRTVDFPARLGGDEFALLMPQTDYERSTQVLNRIFSSLAEQIRLMDAHVGISMGAVTFATIPESADQAIAIADKLMYSVKASGKHQLTQLKV